MKNTPEIREYIKNNVERVCNFLDVPLISNISFEAKDFHKIIHGNYSMKKINYILGCHHHEDYKVCDKKCDLYFNVRKFETIRRLNFTIVHEIMHHTKRRKHTHKFYKDIVKNCNKLFDGFDFEKYELIDNEKGFIQEL